MTETEAERQLDHLHTGIASTKPSTMANLQNLKKRIEERADKLFQDQVPVEREEQAETTEILCRGAQRYRGV